MGNNKKKKSKKVIKRKTKEERVVEIIKIKTKLRDLGLSDEFDGIAEFYKYCNTYINDGIAWSGKIKLLGLKRVLEAVLTTRKTVGCSIVLKYAEYV